VLWQAGPAEGCGGREDVCVCEFVEGSEGGWSQVGAQTSRGSCVLQQGWRVVAVAPPTEQLYSESPSRRLVVPGALLGGDDSTTIASRIGCLHAVFDLCALKMLDSSCKHKE
jgi:hypothetical protein